MLSSQANTCRSASLRLDLGAVHVDRRTLVKVVDAGGLASHGLAVGDAVLDRRHVLGVAEDDLRIPVALGVPGGGQARAPFRVLHHLGAGGVAAVVLVVAQADVERDLVVQAPNVVEEGRLRLEVGALAHLEDRPVLHVRAARDDDRVVRGARPGAEDDDLVGVEEVPGARLPVVRLAQVVEEVHAEAQVVRSGLLGREEQRDLGEGVGVAAGLRAAGADGAEDRRVVDDPVEAVPHRRPALRVGVARARVQPRHVAARILPLDEERVREHAAVVERVSVLRDLPRVRAIQVIGGDRVHVVLLVGVHVKVRADDPVVRGERERQLALVAILDLDKVERNAHRRVRLHRGGLRGVSASEEEP